MVIVITGILGVLVVSFVNPLQGYFDAIRRADLSDVADTALRRMARELHTALSNSVRVSGGYIEFLPTTTGGRYRAVSECNGATCDQLDFSLADTSFDVIGILPLAPAVGNELVIYNLGIPGSDAYEGSNVATLSTGGGCTLSASKICFNGGMQFPFESPGRRFQVIAGPVTFACVGTTLWRYSGYARQLAQPTDIAAAPLSGATSKARLATGVDCATTSFAYESGVTQRTGLVSMRLTMAAGGESITLQHQVHVPNVP